jgi:hypothetical protein
MLNHPAAETAEMVPSSWCGWKTGENLIEEEVCVSPIGPLRALSMEAERLKIVFSPLG